MANEISVSFNPTFHEANASRARYRILMGSAGSGKSYNTAQDYILKLSDRRFCGANLMVVRKTEASARTSAFAELCGAVKRIFGARFGEIWRISEDRMFLECAATGGRIIFRGVCSDAQRERIKSVSFSSGKLTWIWIEEATELLEADFDMLDDRLRGALGGINPNLYYQITMTFNPVSARHWIKRRFFDVPDDRDVFISKSVYTENRFIDPDYARRMERRRESDPDGYRVYALGEWGVGSEGLILPNYEVGTFSREDFSEVWYAQDFGFNHADCILETAQRDGDLYVLREIYVHGRDTSEIISLAEGEGFSKNAVMYCDSAEPDRIKTWRRAGYRAVGVKKEPGSVNAQIDFLRSRRIYIDSRCVNTVGEISQWCWMRDGESGELTDTPAFGCDDAMAALRYSVEGMRRGRARTVDARSLGL